MQQALLIICLILFIIYAAIIIYYAISWRRLKSWQLAVGGWQIANTQISLIIPARNEEANIAACIQSIINQSYPKNLFEIIVVDDHSTDATASIVQAFNLPNIKCIALKNFIGNETNSYKKKAIEIGIAQASGELIITTDADCTAPPNWLQTIASFYKKNNAKFIVMPVAINCGNKFIEIFQALDFMTLQGITGAAVHKKIHSMCNGANMAYTKKVFYEVEGFKNIDTIASGDDMLLMHKIYSKYPNDVLYLKSKEVIIQTAPVHTIADFFNQRIRWASKADKYDDKRMLPVLVVVYFFNVILLVLPFSGLVFNAQNSELSRTTMFNVQYSIFEMWLGFMLSKTFIEIIFLYPVAKFFNKTNLLWWFPIAQPVHILYTVIAGWLGKFGTYKWKDRKVK